MTVRAERSSIVFRFVNSRLLTRKFYEIRVFAPCDRFFFLLFENLSPRLRQSPCFRFFDRFRSSFFFEFSRFCGVDRLFVFNRFFFFGLLFGYGFRFYFFFYGFRFDFGRLFGDLRLRLFLFFFFRLFRLPGRLFFQFDDFLLHVDSRFRNFDGSGLFRRRRFDFDNLCGFGRKQFFGAKFFESDFLLVFSVGFYLLFFRVGLFIDCLNIGFQFIDFCFELSHRRTVQRIDFFKIF